MRRVLLGVFCALLGLALAAGSAGAAGGPTNDGLSSAESLSGPLPLIAAGTTIGATREAGEPVARSNVPSGHSVWYRWQPPSTGYVSIETCESEQRMDVAIYTGSGSGSLSEVGSEQEAAPSITCQDCYPGRERVTFTAHAGQAYWIQVDGDGRVGEWLPAQSGEGSFHVLISRLTPPPNDDFANATPLEATKRLPEVSPRVDNYGATREPGEPNHRGVSGGASVWFEWTASRTGGVWLQNGTCEAEAVAAVYTGASVDALTPVPEIEPRSICDYAFYAITGTTYRIAIDGRYDPALDAAEMFDDDLSLTYLPYNDDFADAPDLGDITGNGGLDTILPPTFGATKEPGEPDHAGIAGGASVWYDMKATNSGSTQLSVCENDFPALVAIYAGSRVDALTPIAAASVPVGTRCPHNERGPGELQLNVVAGTTYHLAVDGVGGATGHYEIQRWDSTEPLHASGEPASPLGPRPLAPASASTKRARKPSAKIIGRKVDQRLASVAFALRAAEPGTHFLCKLDRRRFTACGSSVTYRRLTRGHHVFRALAVDAEGEAGAPLKAAFAIRRPR